MIQSESNLSSFKDGDTNPIDSNADIIESKYEDQTPLTGPNLQSVYLNSQTSNPVKIQTLNKKPARHAQEEIRQS